MLHDGVPSGGKQAGATPGRPASADTRPGAAARADAAAAVSRTQASSFRTSRMQRAIAAGDHDAAFVAARRRPTW